MGKYNKFRGLNQPGSSSFGEMNKNDKGNSFCVGMGLRTTNTNEIAVGKFNKSKSNLAFSFGIGSSDASRKNALEIDKNGNVVIPSDSGANVVPILQIVEMFSATDFVASYGIKTVQYIGESGERAITGETFYHNCFYEPHLISGSEDEYEWRRTTCSHAETNPSQKAITGDDIIVEAETEYTYGVSFGLSSYTKDIYHGDWSLDSEYEGISIVDAFNDSCTIVASELTSESPESITLCHELIYADGSSETIMKTISIAVPEEDEE